MTHLKEGDKAPVIDGIDENGNSVSLDDFKGKKVVLYFYPKDMTPGCTLESCNLRDNYAQLKKNGFEILGVSADSQEKHRKFISKYRLPFKLLADVEKKIINETENDISKTESKMFFVRATDESLAKLESKIEQNREQNRVSP